MVHEASDDKLSGIDLSNLLLMLFLLPSLYNGQGYDGGYENARYRWRDHGDDTRQLHGLLQQQKQRVHVLW